MTEERLKRSGEVFLVPFNKIEIDDQINAGRLDLGNIQELADSIKENGLRIPILVKKVKNEDKYTLIQGKRRFKAIELLVNKGEDFAGIKCFLAPQTYKIEDSLFDQIIMNDGTPYTNLEQGIVFSQLSERGYNVTEIATKIGKSITHITNCINMASLPKKVRNMVQSGSVSGLTAVDLFKVVKDESELIEKLEAAVESAPQLENGKKKKITNKNIQDIASASPLKKLEGLTKILKARDIENERTIMLGKLFSRLKAKQGIDELIELFL